MDLNELVDVITRIQKRSVPGVDGFINSIQTLFKSDAKQVSQDLASGAKVDAPDPMGSQGRKRQDFRITPQSGDAYYVKPEDMARAQQALKGQKKPTSPRTAYLKQTNKIGSAYAALDEDGAMEKFEDTISALYDVAEELEGTTNLDDHLRDYLASLETEFETDPEIAVGRFHEDTQRNHSGFFPKPMRNVTYDKQRAKDMKRHLLAPIASSSDMSDQGSSIIHDVMTADGYEGIHKTCRNVSEHKHEVAAFKLSMALGFGNVPATYLHPGDEEQGLSKGVIQEKVKGSPAENFKEDDIDRTLFEATAVFDYILAQSDRHLCNIMIDEDAGVGHSIDNEAAFYGTVYSDPLDALAMRGRDATGNSEHPLIVHPSIVSKLKKVDLDEVKSILDEIMVDKYVGQTILRKIQEVADSGTIINQL